MLGHLINRVKQVKSIDQIIVATTTNTQDNPTVEEALLHEVLYCRGSEEDVMGRVLSAALQHQVDTIVELTADCPLLDPSIISQVVNIFNANSACYVGNAHYRSYPDGMDVQVFTTEALKLSYSMTNSKLHQEHVSLHIRENPNIFTTINVVSPDHSRLPGLGLTLDEQPDFVLIDKIITHFYPHIPSCQDIIHYLNLNQHLLLINNNVLRKGAT